jgi:pimeloyl-ACP methyl ester carboxylesterase
MTLLTSMVLAASAGLAPVDLTPPAESLHVVASGSGPTVVYIPGLFGSAFGFRQVGPLLVEAGYRVVIIEPLGVGSSSRPPKADYSLTAQADRIAGVLDTLHAGPVLIVAHSLGGAIAFRVAVRRPDLVRGFLSVEGGPTEEATTPSFRRAIRWAPLLRIFGGAKMVRSKARGMLTESSGDPSWITDDIVRSYTAGATQSLGATIHAYQAMGRSREPEPLAPRIHEIRCPVRLMVGMAPHEGGVGDPEVALLRRVLASFTIDSVPGVGHWIQEERPAAVLESLQRLDALIAKPRSDGGPGARRARR